MEPNSPVRNVSPERKAGYSFGVILSVVGAVVFFLGFLIFLVNFGNFSRFEFSAKASGLCWFGGMALLIIGQVIRVVSAAGLAGSGVVLDPEQARKDIEPLSRMAGGVVNDALSEVDLGGKAGDATRSAPVEVVRIKCRKCGALNEEDARFCKNCGAAV
jgi:hypothetical protein